MLRKSYHIIIICLVALFLVGTILFVNSLTLAMKFAGLDTNDVNILEQSIDSNNKEFKIIKTHSKKNGLVLVHMKKNAFGIWTVSNTSNMDPNRKFVSIGWMRDGGIRRFSPEDDPKFETEWHNLYYGTNAIKNIEFLKNQLPDNVTINIQQAGKDYSIHVISFGDPEELNKLDIYNMLIAAKCIQ